MTIPTGQPSAAALILPRSTSGVELAIDIITRDPGTVVSQVCLALIEKQPDGSWDWVSSSPGPTSTLWSIMENGMNGYIHADGSTMDGTFLAVANRYQFRMITDYVPRMNTIIAQQVPVGGPPPPSTGFPASSDAEARQLLAGSLRTLLAASLDADGRPVIRVA